MAKCCYYYRAYVRFTGTVVGMIAAFDAIKAANDISPAVVAGGISQALLTTAFGLIVAMIIQTFQNVFVARIDKLILDMEEQSIKILDFLQISSWVGRRAISERGMGTRL